MFLRNYGSHGVISQKTALSSFRGPHCYINVDIQMYRATQFVWSQNGQPLRCNGSGNYSALQLVHVTITTYPKPSTDDPLFDVETVRGLYKESQLSYCDRRASWEELARSRGQKPMEKKAEECLL
jgi:hypothetical protein